jgi:hypothetical protein
MNHHAHFDSNNNYHEQETRFADNSSVLRRYYRINSALHGPMYEYNADGLPTRLTWYRDNQMIFRRRLCPVTGATIINETF